jgi:murein DD-endopeptidase MepM/ murein hydrolase activator NlpD
MTGPVDEFVDRAHHLCVDVDPTSVPGLTNPVSPITSRRHSRRGVLGLSLGLIGAAALIAVDGQSVFAEDISVEATDAPTPPDAAAASPESTDAPPAAADAPAASSPPDAPAPEAAAPPPPPVTAKTYVVQTGDTIYSIAKRNGVSVDAILWANKMTDPNVVKVGQTLTIPPSTGKLHTVKAGDTLDSLAQQYSVSKAGIATVNGLADGATLTAGQRLLIPVPLTPGTGDPAFAPSLTAASAGDPVPVPANAGTGSPVPPLVSTIAPMLIQSPSIITPTGAPTVTVTNKKVPKLTWPIAVAPPKTGVSQGFRPGHTGIDIYAPQGTTIGAAAPGTVKMAEKDPQGFTGYGWIVIVDHGDGISTWYAHLGGFSVKAGDVVRTGDNIGQVGMTGRTTGPHLHFELRVNATPIDPRLALP